MLTDMYEYLDLAGAPHVRQLAFLLCPGGILTNVQLSNYFLLLLLYFVVYVLFLILSFLVTSIYSSPPPFIPPLFHCLSLSLSFPPPPLPMDMQEFRTTTTAVLLLCLQKQQTVIRCSVFVGFLFPFQKPILWEYITRNAGWHSA
jgi:hypothetical protein